MACSLVTVEGMRKVTDQEAMEFARIAGLRFIRLQHIKGAAPVEYGQRGFQTAVVKIVTDTQGGKHYQYELSKNRNTGEDCLGQRQLLFQPDKHTQMLFADLIDTPFNRRVLMKCYYHNAQWTIVDPATDAEIRAMADEFEKSIPKRPSKDVVIKSLSEQLEDERRKNRELVQRMKSQGEIDEAIKEASTSSEDDMLGALGLTQADAKKLRSEAKKEIYEEMKPVLEEIQNSKGRAWASSADYRAKISPAIQARYQTKLEERYAEHAGVGVDN